MDIKVTFPEGSRVDAELGNITIVTNQDGSAPAPFALFLASIGTCAGIYVLGFCRQRGLSTQGLEIQQKMETDPISRMVSRITLEIKLPADFPEKYVDAVIRAADQCAVKKHILHPPEIKIQANLTP